MVSSPQAVGPRGTRVAGAVVLGAAALLWGAAGAGAAEVETPFLIVRIMREGAMDVFATGCYRDKVKPDEAGALRFAERIVVCDGRRFDTLVAIPF